MNGNGTEKAQVIITLDTSNGNIEIKTNIQDKNLVRQMLKTAEEVVITEALRGTPIKDEQKIIPVTMIPKIKPS